MLENIIRINLAQYEPPVFKEEKEGKFIKYGPDGKTPYPDYLIDLYLSSTNHKAAIDAITRYICGNGWTVKSSVMNESDKALYMEKSKHLSEAGESLNELTNRWALEYKI